MQTIHDFIALLLGFVPLVLLVGAIIAAFSIMYRMFPETAEKFDYYMDRLMGCDPEAQEDEFTNYLPAPTYKL